MFSAYCDSLSVLHCVLYFVFQVALFCTVFLDLELQCVVLCFCIKSCTVLYCVLNFELQCVH